MMRTYRSGSNAKFLCSPWQKLMSGGGGNFGTSMSGRAPDFAAVAYLSAKYADVDPYYGEYAVKIMNAAVKIWNDENMGNNNSFGNNVKKMGIDVGSYPSARTYSFDIKFRF